MSSPLRTAEYAVLKQMTLSGNVLDLGGGRDSLYRHLFKGTFSLTMVNKDPEANPDMLHDLEEPLPFKDETYDGVLLINVLEHIYNFEQLLAESARVLVVGGSIVIAVPFLFPIHPSPKDFWRFTDEALSRMLTEAGFDDINSTVLGSGVFSARALLLQRLLPPYVRVMYNLFFMPLAKLCDAFFVYIARVFHKKYQAGDYALGFLVTAKKRGTSG